MNLDRLVKLGYGNQKLIEYLLLFVNTLLTLIKLWYIVTLKHKTLIRSLEHYCIPAACGSFPEYGPMCEHLHYVNICSTKAGNEFRLIYHMFFLQYINKNKYWWT